MLHGVPRTMQIGGYTFPTRDDYLSHYTVGGHVDELNEETIAAIQRDWHRRGQNGCVFAMHAARKLTARQWRYEVHSSSKDIEHLRGSIHASVNDPHNEIMSLVFPSIECRADVSELVQVAFAVGFFQAENLTPGSGLVGLRYRIREAESWVVGFAPLETLPPTRRAPFAELAIRTKPKRRPVHPDLNNEASQAHLADVDLDFDPAVVTRLISKSKTRTIRILGGESARIRARGAKAKVTYDLSAQVSSEDIAEGSRTMQESEKRVGLAIEVARQLKLATDERYMRSRVVDRTVVVKVDNPDFSPNPDALIDIKTKLIDDKALLSVKYGSWHGDTVRQEYEVNFCRDDLASVLSILKLFGHSKFVVLTTTRTIWMADSVVITLDEYNQIGKALFEVELKDPELGEETAIDQVFASLDLIPMDSAQTIAFIGSLNSAKEIQVDLDQCGPVELARELLVRH